MSQDPTTLERARLREGMWLGQKYRLGQLIALDELCASYFAASTAGHVVEANILNPELANVGDFRAGFVRAARASNGLGGVAFGAVQDTGTTDDGLPYFVGAELGDGESVGDLVRRRGRTLPPAEALRIVGNLLSALASAHALGLVHGLIEPNHVFIGGDGSFKIRGLGLSALRIAAASALRLRTPWQALPFIAPEVLGGELPTTAADIWSMGALLFYLLSGESPYAVSGEFLLAAAQLGKTQALNEVEPKAPRVLVELVAQALQPLPEARIASAFIFGARVRAYAQAPEIGVLRFLGDALTQARGSGSLNALRGPDAPRLESDRPGAPSAPAKGQGSRGPFVQSRPSGGYSQLANAVTSVSLSGMRSVSTPPPPLVRAGGTLHTQSTRPPKRG